MHLAPLMLDEDGNSDAILERSENHLFSHTAKMSSEVYVKKKFKITRFADIDPVPIEVCFRLKEDEQ